MKTLATCVLFGAMLVSGVNGADTDWPRWRGSKLDNISPEKGLLSQWPSSGPQLAWKSKGLGSGYSSIVIVGDRIYTMGSKNGVVLLCLDRKDGAIIWSTNVGGGNEPNCTPTVDVEAGLVFGVTKNGDLLCADAKTGDARWRKNFGKDFGG